MAAIAQQQWERMAMLPHLAGDTLRKHGAPSTLGEPVEAVGWFDPGRGALRLLMAAYAGGQRATLRKRRRGSSLVIDGVQA